MENIEAATTRELLRNKIVKILSLLLLIRLGLYIPIPKVDLDILSQSGNVNSIFGFAKNLTGSSFLGLGSLGILPYINASIVIQLLTPVIPALEKLQKEEGELGREQITKYTRYLTFVWALAISTGVAFALVKPVTFNWDLSVALEVILSLTTGSMLSMWFAELITEEKLGNGSSMIIFINIIIVITFFTFHIDYNFLLQYFLFILIFTGKINLFIRNNRYDWRRKFAGIFFFWTF